MAKLMLVLLVSNDGTKLMKTSTGGAAGKTDVGIGFFERVETQRIVTFLLHH
jgi:hypothetical protein